MIKLADNVCGFDTETTGLWPHPLESRRRAKIAPDRPFMFQVANIDGEAVSFRGEVNPRTREVSYDKCARKVRWLKEEVIENPRMRVVGHNLPFERRMTTQSDLRFKWRCKIDDTRVMARVANPTGEQTFGLKPLAEKYLNIARDDEKALKKKVAACRAIYKKMGWAIATKQTHGKSPAFADYWLPDVRREVKDYGEMDPVRTIGLWMFYRDVFNENRDEGRRLWEIYQWERRMMHTAWGMETVGMTYLSDAGLKLDKFYQQYMAKHRRKIDALGWPDLNLQSSPQMQKVFIGELGYTAKNLTKAGNPKIDAEQLMAWTRGSGAGQDVDGDGPDGCRMSRSALEWKAGKKVREYLTAYEFFKCRRPDGSWVIHPAWDQAGARTGRFSCHDPNLMQIASEDTSRRHSFVRAQQRRTFGPRPGSVWYMPDYSQIEVWVFAFVANEKTMMDALLKGEDFHYATARAAWGTRDNFCNCGAGASAPRHGHQKKCLANWWRQRAKMILFSRLYGGGIDKIAYLIRCKRKEAQQFIEDFNRNLPGVAKYMEDLIYDVRHTGVLTNLFGREYLIESNKAYKAVNYMVQGSSAEVMKRAIVRVDRHLRRHYRGCYAIGSVHDELICEIARRWHHADLMLEIMDLMQRDSHYVPNLPVKLPVGFKYTDTDWSHAKEVKFLSRAA